MSDEALYTLEEAHKLFAKKLNGEVWNLLDQPSRTAEEDERMVYTAHASCCHWLKIGTPVHHQRGEWLISRVYAVIGQGEQSLRHAERCMALTVENPDYMADFDLPFAHECLARAYALVGRREDARRFYRLAEQGGGSIADEEDRTIFFDSLRGGDWHGAV